MRIDLNKKINDYRNGNYLEQDEKYGFTLIFSFSKSILNFPFKSNKKLIFNDQVTIAVHIHSFYEDLLTEIISKGNLIPLKYDLLFRPFVWNQKNFKKMLIEFNC